MSNENVESRLQPQVATEDSPIFPDTSASCVDVWMEKMNKGVLTSLNFREFWRVWVPKIYSPERNGNCLAWSIDEAKAQKILFSPLEEFICNGDPQVVLKELTKMDNPPSMCGRVFKLGEPTYSCRECGVDSTCVLCVGCFQQSAHRDHKYKMGTSGGGGCCDCGDTEAWKKAPFCDVHLAGTQSKELRGNNLPGDIAERAVMAFEAVLEYCYELLTLKYTVALPANLCVKDTACFELATEKLDAFDSYCTVLFNDETHTFDQVINTLTRVLKCLQRDAVEYVNNVDREGRAVVRCSVFRHCNELRSDIERFTSRHSSRPLKVLVLHTHVVAHQTFSMKLLNWLQQFISHCEGFRVLFSNIALNTKLPDTSIVEGILTRDSQLWKSARTAWHRLFITGMLMEYESKKALAVVFTHNYGSVMKDFIRDDHDHSFSIVSLSVQLFTVPTLAHHLIAHHDALFTLLNTLLSEVARRCNAAGKLEFERNTPNTLFKRALYIFYDLRYILSAKPDEWTDELRVNYLHGVTLLLTLFCSMQCMDAVLRQVGQHMEYEPEWESAITLHFKLSPVITLGLDWCGSDKVVLVASFRMVLRKLYEQLGNEPAPSQVRELADHSATCLQYDVSSQPVSIHLPLSRFLAGLFLHLEKYNLHFQSAEFISQTKPTPEQIIEPVLTAQVMISQVYSGMWRRNGYSVLNQLYFYHSVKCRHEMLDRDIILLQVGASLIESNEFLIHILNKFNLLNWAQPDFEANALKNQEEDSMRQTINLVEEFLGLLITIIGERYVPGVGQVTTDDRFKKEIIQQLCIKPQPHSELIKQLVDDVQHLEPDMETVICEVADFKKPAHRSAGKGVYELKPHLYSEYNVFFYHYTKEELSISEEAQRKRRKALGELECCPPPKLPRLTETFSLVANLLQCDVMLHIMQTVLGRAQNFIARSFSEPQVHKILHLIGYALQEQESGHYPFLAFPERAAKWNIYKLLEDLSNSQRIDAHKDLLKWTLAKYREVASYTTMDVTLAPPQVEQSADTGETKKLDKEWRTRMAAQKRAKVMAQMAAMQKHFMKKNATLFEEAALDVNKSDDHGSVMDLTEPSQEAPVAVGVGQTSRICEQKTYTCILCQEDQTVTAAGPAMVLATFVQQSTVLCQRRPDNDEINPVYLSAKLGASPYTSTCGHVMHGRCWQDYFDNVLAKENRRPYRMRQPASFDAENHEYLCPLCECLSNTVLLLVPPLGMLQPTPKKQPDISFETWLEVMWLTLECKPNRKHGKKAMEVEDEEMLEDTIVPPMNILRRELGDTIADAFESVYSQPGPYLVENMEGMIHLFAALFTHATYLRGIGPTDDDHSDRVPLWAWKSTAYTIHAIEFLLRDMEKPLLGALSSRQRDSIQNLTRMSSMLGTSFANHAHLWADREVLVNQAMTLLTILLENPHQGPCIFDWDPFGMLVPLINLLPSLFYTKPNVASPPIITGGVFESHALKLIFICHIVKILLTIDLESLESSMDVDLEPLEGGMDVDNRETDGAATENTADSNLALIQILGTQISHNMANELWRRAETACKPFLRCCVLYFHYVTDVPAPETLMQVHGDTYENMCVYLGLPTTCRALINSNLNMVLKLTQMWKSHPTVWQHLLGVKKVPIVKDPLRVNKLIDLPEDYSDLINSISTFSCPNNEQEDSRNPTLCLVCGQMLCSQSYCCQTEVNKIPMGACTYHAIKCGTGVGMFLRVRECDILFLRTPTRGTHMCPPYLDEYGETDQGLRRGNPLHLCHEKYRRLNYIWLSHELHESIARAIESSSSMVPTQWQHM
ncbi:E3 ubiquitin-protein ligase UBR2 [Odontomachus brunneus]|uniref:E3 ubiquitin-protein ligase UBR2 n=1 Tax=Odontomachus brunneus TaxID=486640 RepID=UPI0013F1CB0E|nr:E3 ubiquitin-protein ligase UBR2 [Odontomachus brunneus]XP_032673469.1 E3 ubiquitin-protein ligase UBR2 [Odontomachus brunneus]XP_032673470.1 E3 ubiquitin-protein ligase UBR2 [Odontomachus brunneus]XP_032673471.1 E3 ubiquitin-protein ligase UBR2 [Odontomachus brunneus]XP_032673472.1 E3 ubiquitin-protein ligase UBR2 [Odontomachus brunneus]